MEIKLMNITLENFKGIKHLEVQADGENLNIYGANRSGKTTINDAYHWLLFNKDSQNNADFGIKTLENGKVQHMLDHSVAATFQIDGKATTLKKTFKEKWTKKRGHSTKEFTGHITEYEINDVPKKKKEFDAFINGFIENEKVFRLVSDPFYFNTLKTDEKREILLGISGDVTDAEVIEKNDDLKPLQAHLDEYTIDELRAKNNRDKKAINKKLEENPVRIDELKKGMADDQPEASKKELEQATEKHRKAVHEADEALEALMGGEREKELRTALFEAEGNKEMELLGKKREAKKAIEKYLDGFDDGGQRKLDQLKYENEFEQSSLDMTKGRVRNKKEQLEYQKKLVDDYRADYRKEAQALKEVEAERKEFDVKEVCECCGQSLPADQVEAHREKQQKAYNEDRANKIEMYQSSLKKLAEKGKQAAETVETYQSEAEQLEKEAETIQEKIERNNRQMETLKTDVADPKDTKEYKSLVAALENIDAQLMEMPKVLEDDPDYMAMKEELQALKGQQKEKEAEIKADVEQHQQALKETERELARYDALAKDQSRIDELLAEQETLADEYEKLEHLENMLNEFTTAKVELLENSISKQFEHARFNLFEPQINGGLKEICETTFDGVPYSKGLNTEARVNVGLDIIKTLCRHYDFYAPIFIDNAESVTDIFETDSQQIRLIVSKDNQTLKMEKEF